MHPAVVLDPDPRNSRADSLGSLLVEDALEAVAEFQVETGASRRCSLGRIVGPDDKELAVGAGDLGRLACLTRINE